MSIQSEGNISNSPTLELCNQEHRLSMVIGKLFQYLGSAPQINYPNASSDSVFFSNRMVTQIPPLMVSPSPPCTTIPGSHFTCRISVYSSSARKNNKQTPTAVGVELSSTLNISVYYEAFQFP